MLWLRKKLRRLWLVFKNRLWGKPIPFETVHVSELPDNLLSSNLYLIGANAFLWIAALLCPCGCQSVIQLNLLPDAHPCWKVREHKDATVSLAPSIWSRKGCESHYFISQGLVKWAVE